MEVVKVTPQNIDEMQSLYGNFATVAQEDFLFELPPLPFQDFKANFNENYVQAYMCKTDSPAGFLLYSDTLTQGIEITLIYTSPKELPLKIQTALLKQFIKDAKEKHKNKIISYPMLGVQDNLTQDISNLGFSLVGEAILDFNFYNTISQVVLKKSQTAPLPENYTIDKWYDKYFIDAAKIINEEFSKLNDAKFDPRFLSYDGAKDVLECITNGYYGEFLANSTTVLKYNDEPVGFCFTNLTTPQVANIPIMVIKKEHQHKGLGSIILKNSVNIINDAIINGDHEIKNINTTCDTNNFSALKTYRKIGFKEKNHYTHAFMQL